MMTDTAISGVPTLSLYVQFPASCATVQYDSCIISIDYVFYNTRAAMDEKETENPVEPERTPVPRKRLVPGRIANFPGSLVVNHIGIYLNATSYPQDKGRLASWVAYFREGWDDPAIWKSAVSI